MSVVQPPSQADLQRDMLLMKVSEVDSSCTVLLLPSALEALHLSTNANVVVYSACGVQIDRARGSACTQALLQPAVVFGPKTLLFLAWLKQFCILHRCVECH